MWGEGVGLVGVEGGRRGAGVRLVGVKRCEGRRGRG